MSQRRLLVAAALVSMLLLVPAIQGYDNGIYNRSSGCGGGCHSQTGSTPATVSISGLPNSYDVNKLYQVTVSVSGGVQGSSGGFSLEVDKGVLSTGMGLMLVKVNNQGSSATHTITGSSYRSWSFEWTAPAAGSGTVTFEVAGMTTNGNGQNSGDRWATNAVSILENVPVNNPPSATNVLLAPTDAKTTDSLTLSYSYSDPDSDPQSGSEIIWYRDSQALPAGTISGLTVPSSETIKGQEWYATVKPSDGSDYGELVTSNTVVIENSPPSLAMPTISPSSADVDDDLTVSYSSNDDDQDLLSVEINWYLDGVLISEFSNDTVIPAIATRQADKWRVEVSVSDGEDVESRSSQVLTIGGVVEPNNPPEITSALITPNQPVTVDDLHLIFSAQDSDNDPIIDTEIEWRVNSMLTVDTSSTILSTTTQKGEIWQAKVRVSDGMNWSDWLVQEVVIANSAPIVNSVLIAPTQVVTNNSVLVSYEYNDLDGDESNNPSIVWLKNGVEQIALNDLNPLPAVYTSKGDVWTASVRANDGESYSEIAIQATFTVQNSIPTININEIPSNVTFANSDLAGIDISPQFSDLDDDSVYHEIRWLRNGFREGSLDNATFVPAEYFGAGQTWTLSIHYHDNDSLEQLATWAIVVDNLPPEAIINTQTTNLWRGEVITVDANASFDLDGALKNYLWQWQDSEGNSGSLSGEMAQIIGYGTIGVTLTIEDDLGLTDSVNSIIVTTQGPQVTGLIATNQDSAVSLSWEWSGGLADFIVLRNGEQVGLATGLGFEDEPLIAGATSYTITPVVEGQTLLEGSMTVADFEVSISVEPNNQISETGGFVLAVIFILSSFAVISLSIFERRR